MLRPGFRALGAWRAALAAPSNLGIPWPNVHSFQLDRLRIGLKRLKSGKGSACGWFPLLPERTAASCFSRQVASTRDSGLSPRDAAKHNAQAALGTKFAARARTWILGPRLTTALTIRTFRFLAATMRAVDPDRSASWQNPGGQSEPMAAMARWRLFWD